MDAAWTVAASGVFLGVSFAMPVGPVTVAQVRAGLQAGLRRALLVAAGSLIGDGFYAVLAYLGLAPLGAIPAVRVTMLCLGAGVLTWLGWSSVRDAWQGRSGILEAAAAAPAAPAGRRRPAAHDTDHAAFLTGFSLSMSNPLAIAWFATVGGAMVAALAPAPVPALLLLFFGAFLAGSMAWGVFLALAVHWGKRLAPPGVIRGATLVAGAGLLLFALRLGAEGARMIAALY